MIRATSGFGCPTASAIAASPSPFDFVIVTSMREVSASFAAAEMRVPRFFARRRSLGLLGAFALRDTPLALRFCVTTDEVGTHFHRFHRYPGTHSVAGGHTTPLRGVALG